VISLFKILYYEHVDFDTFDINKQCFNASVFSEGRCIIQVCVNMLFCEIFNGIYCTYENNNDAVLTRGVLLKFTT